MTSHNLNRLIKFIVTISCIALCNCTGSNQDLKNDYSEIRTENEQLKDSLGYYREQLRAFKSTFSFKGIKPMIIPKETNFVEGKETEFYLVVASKGFIRGAKSFPIHYDIQSSLGSVVDLETKNGDDMLSYRPLSPGYDTIKVNFEFKDPDSVATMQFQIEYPIEIKRANTASTGDDTK